MDESAETGGRIRIRRGGAGRAGRVFRSRWMKALYALIALIAIACLAIWLVFARDLPSTNALLSYEPPLPTNMRAYDGSPVYTFARERRVELSYREIPPQLIEAFISAEDKTFFSHHGIDFGGLASAVLDYARKYGTGERARGGSTITQQVAKNLLTGNQYSIRRKIREAILAWRIEDELTKQQILDIYLNQIFLGRNAYGVEAAAQAYFGKDVRHLDLPEMAYLAILPKAPSNYSPEHDAERALGRRAYVLNEMHKNGYITAADEQAADAAPLGAIPRGGQMQQAPENYFIEEVRRELIQKFGETDQDGPYSVYAGGLWVRSSYDPEMQDQAAKALRDELVRYESGRGWSGPSRHIDPGEGWQRRLDAAQVGTGYDDWKAAVVLSKSGGEAKLGFEDGSTGRMSSGAAAMPKRGVGGSAYNFLKPGDVIVVTKAGGGWALRSIPVISGGMVVENPHTGQVLAIQGGFDFKGQPFDRATQAMRQPGSTIKPIVYSAALDAGMTPASIVVDGPFCVYQSAALGTKCFRNFEHGYAGPQTMRWGLEQSRNLMTVRIANQIGMKKVVQQINALGIGSYPQVLSIALGAGDTTVIKMVNAFSAMDNLGRQMQPSLIDYVQDRHGKVIWRADNRPCTGCNAPDWNGGAMPRPPVRGHQAIDAMSASQTLHMMEGVVKRGTAVRLRDFGRPLFGKTGTTTGPTNVWFIGGSADLVGGVYIGYDHPRPLGGSAQGATIALPVFEQWATAAMKDMPIVPLPIAPGIRLVRIDRHSGRRVFGAWPSSDPLASVIWEQFKPATEPKRTARRADSAASTAIAKAAAKAAPPPRDSEFLQRQGGIY